MCSPEGHSSFRIGWISGMLDMLQFEQSFHMAAVKRSVIKCFYNITLHIAVKKDSLLYSLLGFQSRTFSCYR